MDLTQYPNVRIIDEILREKFPYFLGTLSKQYTDFGDEWLSFFETDLESSFGNDATRLESAIQGYGAFALASMRLQIKFQETHEYKSKTYEEAANEVYQNRDYMFNLYLPGIYLSHFLWRHHYRQHVFYKKEFIPLVQDHGGPLFYDIGVGTGFYSKEMLRINPEIRGQGFDLSPFSLEYTDMMLSASNLANRYTGTLQNIITEPVQTPAPFIINIEVLEHLENPQAFLNALYHMLEPGGYGLISAAINAPNADHIYLYRKPRDVIEQIESAGFHLVNYVVDEAYEPPTPGELVPVNAAFIVTR